MSEDLKAEGVTLDANEKAPDVQARFWSKVQKSDGCWNWTASKIRGYGSFHVRSGRMAAHRYSYLLLSGIPDGLTLDHLCRNKSCVRPDHLEAVSIWENTRRGTSLIAINSKKEFCKHGHKDWLITHNKKRNKVWRYCRPCRKGRDKRWRKTPCATSVPN
jgi:hypothetical protein